MKRQTVLLWILGLLVVLVVPYLYIDQASARLHAQQEAAMDQLLALRKQARDLTAAEEKVTARVRQLEAANGRFVGESPFATIQSSLSQAAKLAGVTLGAITLEVSTPVPDLPGVVRIGANVQVQGDRLQFLEFLRLLESHPLLIEIPDISLKLPAKLPAKPGTPVVRTTAKAPPEVDAQLPLAFFGKR